MSCERGTDALYAVREVAIEYGFATGQLKPCVALLLDGNLGGAARHDAAFVIAMECVRCEWTQVQAREALARWAQKIDYSTREVEKAIRSAYSGKYHPAGLRKKQTGVYGRVLAATCSE